ncbi:MAG: CoA transferase [Aquabacterium sp.]|uniref:CaiB/BaiF CoA transferase family protein n=1 Tax=Aquabacterium sp. TaxID=1872578 RepID=UPI00271DC7FE|nr:CoA transferase [Aquabacterium sp.]MDO9004131.1 CoA transferase [Aquabacterium sp.]
MIGSSALLSGLRVIDITRNLPGPFATRMLADLGAEVIKVEPPEGDPARALGPLFKSLNDGKECRTLDFKLEADRAQLRDWLASADVLLEGFRPGIMASMGLDFERLKVVNPRLVMCSITGYGQQGLWSHRAGHDLNYMAMSGALDQMRSAQGEATLSNIQWGDLAGGSAMACIATLAAVFKAQQSGTGCHVDVSMTHGLWAHQVMPQATGAMLAPMLGRLPGARQDLLNGALPCYNLYTTQDGRSLAIGSLEHKFWKATCEVLQRPDWAQQHWQRGLMPNSPESNALREQVAALVATQPLSHWAERFAEVDACVTPVLTLAEAQQHPLFTGEQTRQPWTITP